MYFGSNLLPITVRLIQINAANNSLYYATYRVVAGINHVIGRFPVKRVSLFKQLGKYGFRTFFTV